MNNGNATMAVTLTREQIYTILVHHMGWEPEDVTAFWRVTKKLHL